MRDLNKYESGKVETNLKLLESDKENILKLDKDFTHE